MQLRLIRCNVNKMLNYFFFNRLWILCYLFRYNLDNGLFSDTRRTEACVEQLEQIFDAARIATMQSQSNAYVTMPSHSTVVAVIVVVVVAAVILFVKMIYTFCHRVFSTRESCWPDTE